MGFAFKLHPTSLDMERKKIAGAFTSDHMLHYLRKVVQAYDPVPVFAIYIGSISAMPR